MSGSVDKTSSEFIGLLRGMYARPEFHYPIVAAQLQYRLRYYGLSGAAMLEDLFFDALSNFVRMHAPHETLVRPPRGEKGYDYKFNGVPMSHKVSKRGPEAIAALWDATKSEITHWNFETSICFTSGGYQPTAFRIVSSRTSRSFAARPASSWRSPRKVSTLVLMHWPVNEPMKVLDAWLIDPSTEEQFAGIVPFADAWRAASRAHTTGIPANEIEILTIGLDALDELTTGTAFTVETEVLRPGVYLIERQWLQNVPVKPNNRGLLVSKTFVKDAMIRSHEHGLHIPLSDWFSAYSGDNPPDLYLAQKAEYDMMFSRNQSGFAVAVQPFGKK